MSRHWSAADTARMRKLRRQHHSLSAIAHEFGTTRSAVGSLLRRQGLSDGLRHANSKSKYPPAAPGLRASPVLALEAGGCHWPIGEPGTTVFRFCTDKALPRRSYCAYHFGIARQ